jgi:hypothetical protein
MGMPPCGRETTVEGIEIFWVSKGRIAEMWHRDDLLGLMQQLGAIPAPEQASTLPVNGSGAWWIQPAGLRVEERK